MNEFVTAAAVVFVIALGAWLVLRERKSRSSGSVGRGGQPSDPKIRDER